MLLKHDDEMLKKWYVKIKRRNNYWDLGNEPSLSSW